MNMKLALPILCQILLSCATGIPQRSESCQELASQPNSTAFIYGYGSGDTATLATQNARLDLAQQLITHIDSSSSVTQTNTDTTLETNVASRVSQIILGSEVVRRCLDQPTKQVVVRVNRSRMAKQLAIGLRQTLRNIEAHLEAIEESKLPGRAYLKILEAKQYLAAQEFLDTDYLICKTLAGCPFIDLEALFQLKLKIHHAPQRRFSYQAKDSLAQILKPELTENIQKTGVILDQDQPLGEVQVRCRKTLFPKIQELGEQFIELSCTAKGILQDHQIFSYDFKAKGFGQSEQEAFKIARNQLERD